MNPRAALDEQIARYRRMTGEQRLGIALALHELACDVAREGIRTRRPNADDAEVERQLRSRIALGRGPQEPHREDRLTEHELLADCLRRLNGLGLAYMLTGSMASNFWGVPGTTHDLDFVLSL